MIAGVKIIKLSTHKDERGFFREIVRFKEQFNKVDIQQLSHSLVKEDVIKAWHGHIYQSQWNYVISGALKVALFDNRQCSETYEELLEFNVSNDEPIMYFFPPGILHGYKCIAGPMHIIYATSGVYDLSDELRVSIINKDHEYNKNHR